MLQEVRSEAESIVSAIRPIHNQDPVLLVAPVSSEHKYIKAARQVVVKVMRETPVLLYTQAASLVEIILNENVTSNHACMAPKRNMHAYPDRPFYLTVASFRKTNVYLPKH